MQKVYIVQESAIMSVLFEIRKSKRLRFSAQHRRYLEYW